MDRARTPRSPCEESGLKPEEEKDFLVRLLAQSQLEAAFERTYYLIFGSQITALRKLNARGGRATLKEAQDFYQVFESRSPEFYMGYRFDGWLTFLINSGLINREDCAVVLTDIGRDFLLWMTAQGRPENRTG
jgi:hypothetical protein